MKLFGTIAMLGALATLATSPNSQAQSLQRAADESPADVATQNHIDRLQAMSDAEKEVHHAQMRELIVSNIDSERLGYICSAAITDEYSLFTETVDYVKTLIPYQTIKNMTYAEFAFYVECDENLNAFSRNIHQDYLRSQNGGGLSRNTLGLIRAMGPLLEEKGPDGRTALEYVQAQLDSLPENGSRLVRGHYLEIKDMIDFVIRDNRLRQNDLLD